MIQDIYPHKLNNHYRPEVKPDEDSVVFCFDGDSVLVKEEESFPIVRDFNLLDKDELIYLFSVDEDKTFFLLRDLNKAASLAPAGFSFINIRSLRRSGVLDKCSVFAAFTALHLSHWYENNKYCGRCGARTFLDDKERALKCSCGNTVYPRLAPAVIVGVLNKDKMLVTKYNRGYQNFALVAGFTEIGETLEECVAREVMEETGLKVKNIRYYKSQPWGIVDDILTGFYCDVDGSDAITMDESELKVAEWRTKEDIELQPDDFSLTNEMMKMFKEGKLKAFHN